MARIPVIKWRALPDSLTRQIPIAIVEDGADNEDLARAYKRNVDMIGEENKIRHAHIDKINNQSGPES